ncbi:MAG TPA: DUF6513 domain-containing protein, partial [Fimbriiglobus sp.]
MSDGTRPRVLFVTGKLAEPALRRTVDGFATAAGIVPEVAVLPISVAALMTTDWVARHVTPQPNLSRAVLPGYCRGETATVETALGIPVERGPKDLRDLPSYFGGKTGPPPGYGAWDIEILAEINHAPQMSVANLLASARRYRASGADVIDLGCDPGGPWNGVGDAVRTLTGEGFRVSVDSFDPNEVEAALAAGAELVLSVNGSNVDYARHWKKSFSNVEVVAIPDVPHDLDSMRRTGETLKEFGVKFRL